MEDRSYYEIMTPLDSGVLVSVLTADFGAEQHQREISSPGRVLLKEGVCFSVDKAPWAGKYHALFANEQKLHNPRTRVMIGDPYTYSLAGLHLPGTPEFDASLRKLGLDIVKLILNEGEREYHFYRVDGVNADVEQSSKITAETINFNDGNYSVGSCTINDVGRKF